MANNTDLKFEEVVKKYWLKAVLACFALMIGCGSYFNVGAGEVGVVYNSFTGNTSSHQRGMHLKVFWFDSVTKFDVQTQKEDVMAESASKDLQKVGVKAVINYHLNYEKVDEVYVKVGSDYSEKVIHPTLNEVLKAATAQFPAVEIIVKREELKKMAEENLKTRLLVYNIILESLNLANITFEAEFNKVVEAKQIEEQKIKTAQYKRQQAEENKKTTILDAQAEAEKQRLLSNSVTKDVISLKWIEAWKEGGSKMPQVIGSGSNVFMDMRGKSE